LAWAVLHTKPGRGLPPYCRKPGGAAERYVNTPREPKSQPPLVLLMGTICFDQGAEPQMAGAFKVQLE